MLNLRQQLLLLVSILLYIPMTSASGLLQFFKDEQGDTKWQYVANFSSGVLIILLSITVVTLFFIYRKAHKANQALENTRNMLERRVQERTATLDEYNKLLKDTNLLLEGEIAQHKNTTNLLRSSEAYIKNILESMPLILIGLDQNNVVTHWNKLAEKITGLDSEQAVGKNLWKAYPTITLAPDQITKVLQENKPVTIKHSQRGQYYFDITIYPLREQNEPGVVILIDNVTQRKLAENMLIQRDKMSSMGELASTMAHDIDTPLQAILKNIQAVLTGLNSNAQNQSTINELTEVNEIRELLVDAADKGKQTLGIINNLLDFARAHGDKKRFAYIPDIVEHTLELAESLLSEPSGLKFRDITIEKSYADNLPNIPCYVAELQQVFLSLFRHACHALGQVNKADFIPCIQVELSHYYEALWIKVQHNGVGLSVEEQQSIFEPFFVSSTSDKKFDAGKALSFSYFIITEHHRGQIAVTSDIEVGTTFHIQLQLN